jgi:hypothetical protein
VASTITTTPPRRLVRKDSEKVREKLNCGVEVTQFVLACGKSNVFLKGSQAMLARPHDNNDRKQTGNS